MKTQLHGLQLSILAALGLSLPGCSSRAGMDGSEGSGEGSGTSGDSTASADEGEGEGEGDSGESEDTGDDGPPPPEYECENPEPIMQAGTELPSGFVMCDDGFIHRVERATCVAPQAEDTEYCADAGGGCNTGADCNEDTHGSCNEDPWGGCACHYGCENDDDCEEGTICACAGVVGERATCIPADCTLTDECGAGLCGLSEHDGCCGNSYKTACADATAPCHVDEDCGEDLCDPNWPEGGSVMHHCSAQSENDPDKMGWGCEAPGWCNCDCGRPFFVGGEIRLAPAEECADWCASTDDADVALTATERSRLAQYWTEIGLFEHASVASFARFCLQLMQLGAPPELLAENQRAMADEIEHARLAFGLASAYAESKIGPGSLPVGDALKDALTPHAIVEGLIVEACVGETLAAVEAQEASLHAADGAVREVLDRIAADELRHAELGWRSLRWILDGADAELRAFALRVMDAAIGAVGGGTEPRGLERALRRHGVLDDQLRAEVREKALASVVRPCAAALREQFVEVAVNGSAADRRH